MKSKLNKAIRNFNSPAIAKMQNLEADGLENFLVTETAGRQAVAAALNASANNRALMTPIRGDFRAPASAATMDFLITRLTNNINATLPVALFGALDRESDYIEVLNEFLPASTTLAVSRYETDKKSLKFTFTNGANVDEVIVSCGQTPYVNYLKGMLQNVIKLQETKIQISDVAKQAQFSQTFRVVDNSQYGREQSDKFTPNTFKSDLQNQNDIRTVRMVIDFDAEKSLVVPVVSAADFTITLTASIAKYEKLANSKGF